MSLQGRATEAMLRLPLGRRVVPRVFLIGAQKAGTTSLFAYLVRHPAVSGAPEKGPHYFDLEYDAGEGWYRSRFPQEVRLRRRARSLGVEPLAVDASPYYLFHPRVPGLLHGFAPDAKLIVLLRDPAERAYSHWSMQRRKGREQLEFAAAVAAEPERLRGQRERLEREPSYHSEAHRYYSYVTRGRYAEQLERWYEIFPRDRLLVLFAADLARDPAAVTQRAFEFLELPAHSEIDYPRLNASGGASPPEDLAWLRATFAEPDARLERLLGRRLPWQDDPS